MNTRVSMFRHAYTTTDTARMCVLVYFAGPPAGACLITIESKENKTQAHFTALLQPNTQR